MFTLSERKFHNFFNIPGNLGDNASQFNIPSDVRQCHYVD